ncbi:hypothetical protein FQN54_005675 [Arachnomyces sp. PD_36]|nr:hypothetical protein FQN54_005675 [Arachnomyces sp. PD_36]
MDAPPGNFGQWLNYAKDFKVKSTSIHDLGTFRSGSKIEAAQYLALHVLWKTHDVSAFDPEEWGLDRRIAKTHLGGNKNWKDYLEMVQEGLRGNPSLGTFDMLWEYQRIVEGLDQETSESDKVAVSTRTRSKTKKSQPQETPSKKSRGQGLAFDEPPSTPTRAPRGQDTNILEITYGTENMGLEDEDILASRYKFYGTPLSVTLPGDSGDYYEFPPLDDEQIVNTALILLLQGVCLRFPRMKSSEWTLQRKAFDFMESEGAATTDQPEDKKGKGKAKEKDPPRKLFQARTDGHLRIKLEKKSRSLAILEVKAKERKTVNPFMQESAQMASWIRAEPDVKGDSDDMTYRRVMISQNHREIYLIIATYDWKYVEYIRNGLNPAGEPSFMTMNSFGPFVPGLKGNMERLGSIIVAFTQQLEEQAVAGQPCRW